MSTSAEPPTPVFSSSPALPFLTPPQALVPKRTKGNMADMKSLHLQITDLTCKALHLPKQKLMPLAPWRGLPVFEIRNWFPVWPCHIHPSTTKERSFWGAGRTRIAFPGRHR